VRRSAVQNSRNPPLQFTKGITGSGPRSRWRSRGAVPTNDEEGQQTRRQTKGVMAWTAAEGPAMSTVSIRTAAEDDFEQMWEIFQVK
jgi:hypothetical protein